MARKKIEPLFEEPAKKIIAVKKPSIPKTVTPKKEASIIKPKIDKKKEPVKSVAKEKKSSVPVVKSPAIKPPVKKETEAKTILIKKTVKKEITTKKPAIKEVKKVLPKNQKVPAEKVIIPRVKEIKIEEPEDEIEATEKKPAYVKEAKKTTKVNKNLPPVNIKHKLKVGTLVIVTFLGEPYRGVIIELTEEGMYKVRTERGLVLPRAKHEEGPIPDKRYPSYVIKIISK